MDRAVLKKYDALKEEQRDIARRIEIINRAMNALLDTQVVDMVKGTRPDGTYGSIKIKGIPFPEYEKQKEKLKAMHQHYIDIQTKLDSMIFEIESFISAIEDPEIRTILRLKYIDKKTWRDIGRRYGKTHQWAYLKVERFFSE